jgi:hypothetical protein
METPGSAGGRSASELIDGRIAELGTGAGRPWAGCARSSKSLQSTVRHKLLKKPHTEDTENTENFNGVFSSSVFSVSSV